jgi:hypothetical protein
VERPRWQELRKEYSSIPFAVFLSIVEKTRIGELDEEGIQILRLILQEEEDKGRSEKLAEESLIKSRLTQVSGSMIHHGLRIRVSEEVDLECVQAYVVYGLLASTQSRTFAGGRSITKQRLQTVVANKLGIFFSKEKFEAVHAWLLKSGVVTVMSRNESLALNVSRKGCTESGLAIVEEAKRFKLELRSLI